MASYHSKWHVAYCRCSNDAANPSPFDWRNSSLLLVYYFHHAVGHPTISTPVMTFLFISRFKSRLSDHPTKEIYNIASSPAGKTLACTAILWLILFATCKHLLWRDPHAGFFSEDGVYDLDYSLYRQAEAHEFIEHAEADAVTPRSGGSTLGPVKCAAITTFNRDGRQYLNETVGSMLAGLTEEESSVLHLRVLFAHVDNAAHPDWDKRWLNTLDYWGGYNISQEALGIVKEWETSQDFYAKGVYDYLYVLRECLAETNAPYILIAEDDIIFADGWLAKTLKSLAELRQRSKSWLYLRLFYTETSLGWEADADFWYGHQLLTFALAMGTVYLLLSFARRTCRPLGRRLDTPTLAILVLIATPAFTALVFMLGKYNINPLEGVVRMDKHGCCTQALIFPRRQAQGLVDFLHERGSGQTDSLIEEYADTHRYERYALAPQVVQHVGLVSSRNNLAINTRSTWAFWFEVQDPVTLRMEHEELAQSGIWRASGDGS
ncbi:hypothetical protein Q7P37_003291 [Cladosporium fusiforme]